MAEVNAEMPLLQESDRQGSGSGSHAHGLTVVIPVYNRPSELDRALHSLELQTDKRFAVIVCDDGSTVDVSHVVRRYQSTLQPKYIRIDNSGGPARPRNVGIAAAESEWICLLDCDDWWAPNRMDVIRKHLSDSVDLVYHPLAIAQAGKAARRFARARIGEPIRGDALSHMLSVGNPIPNSAVVVRKAMMERIGGFEESRMLVAFEDFDAWLRIAELGAAFVFINEVLGSYWVGQDNISSVSAVQIERVRHLYGRHLADLPFPQREWAESLEHYVIACYAIRLRDRALAMESLKRATRLRYRSQRLKRILRLLAVRVLL
jgi:glycosyltransferase involved in cell wall biosynthesis